MTYLESTSDVIFHGCEQHYMVAEIKEVSHKVDSKINR